MINKKAYVLQNHKFLTVAQMADELDVGTDRIYRICTELEIEPLTPKEQTLRYIQENAGRKTSAEMSKALMMTVASVNAHLRELGLNRPKGRPQGSKNANPLAPRVKNNKGIPVFIRDEKIVNYVKEHIDEKTKTEIAEDLHISFETVQRICLDHNIKESPSKPGDLDYLPPFEELDTKGHDALLSIFTAVFWHDGRTPDQGCDDWEEQKKKMRAIRPKAEYNVIVNSSTLREYLDEQGYHVKT